MDGALRMEGCVHLRDCGATTVVDRVVIGTKVDRI